VTRGTGAGGEGGSTEFELGILFGIFAVMASLCFDFIELLPRGVKLRRVLEFSNIKNLGT